MQSSARLSLPLLSPGQAQKEIFHNEALQLLDAVVAAAVEEQPSDDPPVSPVEGSCFLVGGAPTGEWAGKANAIAAMTSGGWRFVAPIEGMFVWVKSLSVFGQYVAGQWELGAVRGSQLLIDGIQVVGAQAGPIAAPTGGNTVDVEARDAIASLLNVLITHGLIADT